MFWLFKKHWPLIVFGMICTFLAGFGQTFLLAQFIPSLQEQFALSRTEVSFVYSLATLIASLGLGKIGELLDRWSLTAFSLFTLSGLVAGFFLLSFAEGIITIGLAFFLIRGFGQMNFGLMASTTIAKLFGRHRGKALTWAQFGRSIGEGFLPLIAALVVLNFSLRWSLLMMALILMVITFSMLTLLVPKLETLTPLYTDNDQVTKRQKSGPEKWTWKIYLQEKNALLLIAMGTVLPFAVTGLFFQQGSLATDFGIDPKLMASSFMIYSAVQLLGNLVWGPLVDRFTARRVLPFSPLAMIGGMLILLTWDHVFAVYFYMGSLALSVGMNSMARNSFWAEAYGLEQLGKLKGVDSMVMVMGTAIAPTVFAGILDLGFVFQELMMMLIGLSALTWVGLNYLSMQFR